MPGIEHLCTLAGTCFALGSAFVAAFASPIGYAFSAVSFGLWVKTKTVHYSMLLTETAHVLEIVRVFLKNLDKIEALQQKHGFEICMVKKARTFMDDFKTLLEYYEPTSINKIQEHVSAEWYRLQLQYYVNYMNIFMTNIQQVSTEVLMRIERINATKDKSIKSRMLEDLKNAYKCE